jgi:hypothetical protein
MYSSLTLLVLASIATSKAMMSISKPTKVTGPIGLSTSQEGLVSSRDSRAHDYLAELPSELAELIASAEQSDSIIGSETQSNEDTKYFASFADGSFCSSKPAASFESWESSFSSLEECCEIAFSWDMDACMTR